MRLTRTNVYALRASLQLAAAPRGLPVPCSKLARDGNMPERFLLQVLRVLVRHQVLKSTCGVAGGYYLARSPEHVSLRDLLQPFDDAPQRAMRMLHSVPDATRSRIVDRMRTAGEAYWQELQKVTLAEIARGARTLDDVSLNGAGGVLRGVGFVVPATVPVGGAITIR